MPGMNDTDSASDLVYRLERVPFSRWHLRSRIIAGTATFFDAFDALAIAFVLPVLVREWGLSSAQVGWLLAIGYLGQLAGALLFGAIAERYGRVPSAAAATGLMSLVGIFCAMSGDFWSLMALRLVQGIGIGGEMPVAAVYVNELSKAQGRGRFVLLCELLFPVGLLATAQIAGLVVPALGWKALFLLGGIPGLLVAVLILGLPESPRWLISKGRFAEAATIVDRMEAAANRVTVNPVSTLRPHSRPEAAPHDSGGETPRQADWSTLIAPSYRARTIVVWTLWIAAGFFTNGLVNWMPTLYSAVFGMSVVNSLRAAMLNNVAQIAILLGCAVAIDRIGRRRWVSRCFAGGAALLGGAALAANSVTVVVGLVALGYGLVSTVNAVLYLYTPEIYATPLRAKGTGAATCWLRLASAGSQVLVGYLLDGLGPRAVFLMFAAFAALGVAAALRMIETDNRPLEVITG